MLSRFLPTAWLLVLALALNGCRTSTDVAFTPATTVSRGQLVKNIEYPDVAVPAESDFHANALIPPPTVRHFDQLEFVDLSLEEAVQLALTNSDVIRQVGGRIIAAPGSSSTVFDPSIVDTDPRVGVEAALSAFDAQIFTNMGVLEQSRELNSLNPLNQFRDEAFKRFQMGVSKITATGTQFSFDNETLRTFSDSPFSRVSTTYDTLFSAKMRQPLLQGAGLDFNRIAGPLANPGAYRGVLLGRINTDIALTDFQLNVRNLMRDVERVYWELYFSYRDLDARTQFRQYALEAWDLERTRVETGFSPPDQEAFVREQYYAAQAAIENALSGGGGSLGVFGAERELRSLLGLPASDGRLLRPSTPPSTADLRFDWEESLGLSLMRREELRRQRWRVKQRELELVASRNFRLPKLDAVGQYQWRGYGNDLWSGEEGALKEVFTGDLQGWGVGLEMSTPIGQRAGNAAVRNAQLLLRREETLLREQERQIALELRGAFTELDRAYVVTRSNYNRHVAAQIQLAAERIRFENPEGATTRLDLVLQSQRNAVTAEIAFHRALVDYNLAVSQMNLSRGTLLESMQVYMAEGPVTPTTYHSAVREARRFASRSTPLRSLFTMDPITGGIVPQDMGGMIPQLNAPTPKPDDVPDGASPSDRSPDGGSPSGPVERLPVPPREQDEMLES
jgi:outer membrane protein TolC